MIVLKLSLMRENMISVKPVDEDYRCFSDIDHAEKWLLANGFEFKHRDFYEGDEKEWCHKYDESWDFIEVDIIEADIDNEEKYLRLMPGPSPVAEEFALKNIKKLDVLIPYAVYTCKQAGLSMEETAERISLHYKLPMDTIVDYVKSNWAESK